MATIAKPMTGIVVSSGKMMRAVKVRKPHQVWNEYIKKNFQAYDTYIVSDPSSSVRTGDVVNFITTPRRISPRINHLVTSIVSPWGVPLDQRPAIPTEEERAQLYAEKRLAKLERRGFKKCSKDEVASLRALVQARVESRGMNSAESGSPSERSLRNEDDWKVNKEKVTEEVQKSETEDDKPPGVVEGTMVAS